VSKALIAAAFGATETAVIIALALFGLPVLVIAAVTLAFVATDVLLLSLHPAAIAASILTYLAAILLGVIAFSWGDFLLQLV
jgi:hypothetical protein